MELSEFDKLVDALFSPGTSFTHRDAVALLGLLGYDLKQGRGSAVKFVKPGGTKIFYHVRHGGRKELPEYVVRSIQEIVRREHGHV